ncbi:acyl carrier protein [Cohnella cholangitidis]|nr:phosphopantetheine-binding protein [Cohnella cholangitidis]
MIDARLKEVLLRNARTQINSEDIRPETDLINDLALDSILIVNLFADLEEEFDIRIHIQDITTPILSKYELLKTYVAGMTA